VHPPGTARWRRRLLGVQTLVTPTSRSPEVTAIKGFNGTLFEGNTFKVKRISKSGQ
jgi:hypothetical protein